MDFLSISEYQTAIAATRDQRMAWWREARFGMFVHFGLYAVAGRQEWVMANENINIAEYEKLADPARRENGRVLRKIRAVNTWY